MYLYANNICTLFASYLHSALWLTSPDLIFSDVSRTLFLNNLFVSPRLSKLADGCTLLIMRSYENNAESSGSSVSYDEFHFIPFCRDSYSGCFLTSFEASPIQISHFCCLFACFFVVKSLRAHGKSKRHLDGNLGVFIVLQSGVIFQLKIQEGHNEKFIKKSSKFFKKTFE